MRTVFSIAELEIAPCAVMWSSCARSNSSFAALVEVKEAVLRRGGVGGKQFLGSGPFS